MSNTNDSRPLTQRPAFWWKVTSLAAAAWVMLFASWATAQVNVRMNCPAGYKCLPQAEAGSCGDQFQPFDGALAPGAARGNCPAAAGAPQNCGGGGCKTCFANNNAMRMCIWVGRGWQVQWCRGRLRGRVRWGVRQQEGRG